MAHPADKLHPTIGLAVDVGGGATRVAAVTSEGTLGAAERFATPADGEPRELERLLRLAALEVRSPRARLRGAVVALPGIWNGSGTLERAHHLGKLQSIGLPEFFGKALGCPVRLETDVNAAAIAQRAALRDAGVVCDRFAYVSMGTGLGGAVLMDGMLLRHTHGGAGHLGLLPGLGVVDGDGPRATLEDEFKAARDAGDDQQIARLMHHLAITLDALYAIDTLCMGGGVADHRPGLVRRVVEIMDEHHSAGGRAPQVTVLRAPLTSDEAGLMGAAQLALSM